MRGATLGLALIAGICCTAFAAHAAPVFGRFSGTLSAVDLATFEGDIFGKSPSDFHEGDAVSGTFTYDPALMVPASGPPGFAYSTYNGRVAFEFQIGSHHFAFSGQPANDRVTLLDPGFGGLESYQAAALEYVGNFSTGVNIFTSAPGGLYGDPHVLNSVQFQNMPASFEFGFSEEDPFSSGVTRLGHFEIRVLATVLPTPLPAALPLFGAGLAGIGALVWRRRNLQPD